MGPPVRVFLPELAPRFGGVIRRVYERLDLALGRILEADPGFESVVIASDHGFGGSGDRILHINSYLAEQGLLSTKSQKMYEQRVKTEQKDIKSLRKQNTKDGGLLAAVPSRRPSCYSA